METDNLWNKYAELKSNPSQNSFGIRNVRDLLVTNLTDNLMMIVASDSDGGIGPKEGDTIKCPAYDLGRFAARVPLMEMLASGAIPINIVDTLSVEMNPTGKEIIDGIRDEVSLAGMPKDLAVTGSTEDNVPTIQTGVGVVVIGLVDKKDFRPGTSQIDDAVVCVGIPKSAPHDKVVFSDIEIANPGDIREVGKLSYVHDILPVGSKGIGYEVGELAKSANLKIELIENIKIDLEKSGGPSTCFLVSLPEEHINEFSNSINRPVNYIGFLRKQ